MERSVTVRTPESIAFYYELAGLGSRFLALLLDMVIQGIVSWLLLILGAVGAGRASQIASALNWNQKDFASTVFAIALILFFIIWYGYFIFFEKVWNGQTPGKRMLGIRVVRDGGYPVELLDSIIRNLIRILEQVLGFYLLSVISMLLSSENKRLGDYAAGTIVVRDRGFEVRDPKSWLRPSIAEMAPAQSQAFSQLSKEELALAERYVARKSSLSPRAARETSSRIAAALRPKLGAEFSSLGDDELLLKIASRE